MGKKCRGKPKHKQTGKKRSRGKPKMVSTAANLKTLKQDNPHVKYSKKPEDYEPMRKCESEEEDEVNIEEFYNTQSDLKFLASVDLEIKNDWSRRKKRKQLESEEETYEKKARVVSDEWTAVNHVRLPVKDKTGIIEQHFNGFENVSLLDPDTISDCKIINSSDMKENKTEDIPSHPVTTVELLQLRQARINKMKIQISKLASSILEDPQANIDKLGEINALCVEKDSDISVTVRKLAIVSQLEIFKDIIPSYHIRPLTETEQNVKLSKDIKRLRQFEQGLLRYYQRYLESLEHTIHERKKLKKSSQKGLPMLALQCLCHLLKSHPHFNFRANIMSVLTAILKDDDSNENEMLHLSCETIKYIFKSDYVGDTSLELLQLINKVLKCQVFKVNPSVLETFLFLRVSNAERRESANEKNEKIKQKNKTKNIKMSKNDRKRQKELKKIEGELQEAEAVEAREKSMKMQTEIIKLLFSIYFRVLKTVYTSSLLTPVLAGLSKFTHLINVDFFADLMNILQKLLTSAEISYHDKLSCILTAFKILSEQGEALNIDPQTFYSHLYSILVNIESVTKITWILDIDGDVRTALECLDVMVNKRRKHVSIQRLLAYIKRLCTISLHHSVPNSLAFLGYVRLFLQINVKSCVVLDNDGAGSVGVFRPDITEPEYCNAGSTSLWELSLLRKHYEISLREYAFHISLGNPSQGPGSLRNVLSRRKPFELLEDFRYVKRLDDFINLQSLPEKRIKVTRKNDWLNEDMEHCVEASSTWKHHDIENFTEAMNMTS